MVKKNISLLLLAVVSVALLHGQTACNGISWTKHSGGVNLLGKNNDRDIKDSFSETITNCYKLEDPKIINGSINCKNDYSVVSYNSYVITVNVNGNGIVIGGGTYPKNATAKLTAKANSHHHFVKWSDGNTTNPRTVTVGGDETYTGVFEPDNYTIIVNAGVGGTVNGGGSYTYNTTATLTAKANVYYYFVKWSDGNMSNQRTVTVTDNATYTAIFEPENYIITVMLVVMALLVGAAIILTITMKD